MDLWPKKLSWLMMVALMLAIVNIAADVVAPEKAEEAPPPQIYQYTWTADTITNTESDTLTGVTLYYDLFNYNYTSTATQLSGTTNLVYVLQESNYGSGSEWYEVERDTSGAGVIRLHGADNEFSLTKGIRQRVIITGIGNQSSRYTLKGTWKKTQR